MHITKITSRKDGIIKSLILLGIPTLYFFISIIFLYPLSLIYSLYISLIFGLLWFALLLNSYEFIKKDNGLNSWLITKKVSIIGITCIILFLIILQF